MKHATATDNTGTPNNSQANFADLFKKLSDGAQTALSTVQDLFENMSSVSDAVSNLFKAITERFDNFKKEHQYSNTTILKGLGAASCLVGATYLGKNEIKAGLDIASEFGYDKGKLFYASLSDSIKPYVDSAISFASNLYNSVPSASSVSK